MPHRKDWKFRPGEGWKTDGLCSAKAELPRQLRGEEGFGMLADVWFRIPEKSFTVDGENRKLGFGFRHAFIRVEVEGGEMRTEGLYDRIARTRNVSVAEVNSRNSDGSASGELNADASFLAQFLPFISGKISLSRKFSRVMNREEKADGSYQIQIKSVWSSFSDQWESVGIGTPDNLLLEKIIDADHKPLCELAIHDEQAVKVSLLVSADMRYLRVWEVDAESEPVTPDATSGHRKEKGLMDKALPGAEKAAKQAETNRLAVARAIIGSPLRQSGRGDAEKVNKSRGEGEVDLACYSLQGTAKAATPSGETAE